MGLLDRDSEDPQAKLRRYIILGLMSLVLLTVAYLYFTRFSAEKKATIAFLDAVVRGDTETAYRLWQPPSSYTFQTFLEDWGPQGFYGPVQSYRIAAAQRPRGGSGAGATPRPVPRLRRRLHRARAGGRAERAAERGPRRARGERARTRDGGTWQGLIFREWDCRIRRRRSDLSCNCVPAAVK